MSKGAKPAGDVFDLERIRQIVELMEQHQLSEIDLQQGEEKIKLTRGGAVQPVYMQAPSAPAPAYAQAATAPAPAAAPAPVADKSRTITINSPMVGTYYGKPNPESESFVKVGQMITEDTVVCIIEAMKVFNEIPAECRGKVVEVLVGDQQPVDFGKPLFRVEPTG